jgi:hypothetical protein
MKKLFLLISTFVFTFSLYAQQNNNYAELGGGIGSSVGSINVALHKNWTLGKKDKFVIGTGIRFTSFFGTDVNFTSAPQTLRVITKILIRYLPLHQVCLLSMP